MTMVRRYPVRRRGRCQDHDSGNGRSPAGIALLIALLLLVPACSGGDETSPSAASSTAAGPVPGSAAGAGASPAPSEAALPVLVGRDATVKEIPIRVDLNELRVEGRVTRLTFTASNREPVVEGRTPKRWQIAAFFNDGLDQKKAGASPDDTFSVDGVYLLDGAGAKRYLAARNADRGCVCSGDLSRTFVGPGNSVVLTTLFAALPAGVDSVDVVVPGFGPFNTVAVSR